MAAEWIDAEETPILVKELRDGDKVLVRLYRTGDMFARWTVEITPSVSFAYKDVAEKAADVFLRCWEDHITFQRKNPKT